MALSFKKTLQNFSRFCLICFTVGYSFNAQALESSGELRADKEKILATLGMVRQLSKQHYSKVAVDDDLSSKLLDRYVEALDPSRSFFLAGDIKDFDQYRNKLDDELRLGKVDTAYLIFNTFHDKATVRLQSVLNQLDNTVVSLDFTKQEYINRDPDQVTWATATIELDDRWRKRVKNDVITLKLAKKDNKDIIELLQKRLKRQLTRFNEMNSDDVYTRYMNAYASLYDPHTSHFLPKQRENFDINMSRSLEGIGAVLSRDDELTKVIRLVTGGPAQKQGELKPSDKIIGVGQGLESDIENVVGWRLDEVVDLIRGPKDSYVRLQVTSKKEQNSGKHRTITIKRGKVELEDMLAKSEVLDVYYDNAVRKVGVISVPDFYADLEAQGRGDKNYRSVTRDVKRLLLELEHDGVEGLIMDLRNNGGGSLSEANSLTGLFIGAGPTVQIRHASDRRMPQGKYRGAPAYSGPLVVLINRLSASASEIFAGAIQDYDRGLVVGTTSFGKGTVQTIIPLAEGAIKLTTAKFYRISGESTQYRGVIPDIKFPAVFDPEEVGESALDDALPWDTIAQIRHRNYGTASSFKTEAERRHMQRAQNNPDFVFYRKEYELAQQQKGDTLVPLQLAEREAKQQQVEARYLAIENARRASKGMDLLASLDELDEEPETDDSQDSIATTDDEKSFYDDAYVMEAANVLLDGISLQKSLLAASQ